MTTPADKSTDALTSRDLDAQSGAPLPDREAMSTIDVSGVDNFAAPINEATAVNISSTESYAIADADQIVILDQDSVDIDNGTSDEGDLKTHPNGKDK